MIEQEQTELNFFGKCCCRCGTNPGRLLSIENNLWCSYCAEKYYFKCFCCKKFRILDGRMAVMDADGYGKVVCASCFSENYLKCSHCGHGNTKSNMRNHDNMVLCKYCYDSMFTCIGCQQKLLRDYYYDSGLCRNCWNEERRLINPNHEAKAPLNFTGQGPHFYGIELEVECDEKLERRTSYAKKVLHLFNGFVITKHDGSIVDGNGRNIGFEIVTVPASKDIQFQKWDYFFDNLPKGLRSYDTRTCGLHIHCSRNPLSQLTIAKMLLFVNDPQNIDFITTIAGRNQNQYCKIQKKVLSDYRRARDRYEALNLTNKETVEFRIFRGTLKRESLKKSIEFCDALIHFCMECGHSISDCRKVDKFIEYVKLRKKDWIHLWAFICVRWLRKENDLTKKMGFPLPDKPAEIETYNNEPNPEVQPPIDEEPDADDFVDFDLDDDNQSIINR